MSKPSEDILRRFREAGEHEFARIRMAAREAEDPNSQSLASERYFATQLIVEVVRESLEANIRAGEHLRDEMIRLQASVEARPRKVEDCISTIADLERQRAESMRNTADPEADSLVRQMAETNLQITEVALGTTRATLEMMKNMGQVYELALDAQMTRIEQLEIMRVEMLDGATKRFDHWDSKGRRDAFGDAAIDGVKTAGGLATYVYEFIKRHFANIVEPPPTPEEWAKQWKERKRRLAGHYGWCLAELDRKIVLDKLHADGGHRALNEIVQAWEEDRLTYPGKALAEFERLVRKVVEEGPDA